MITAKGVYTINCPECGTPTLLHVLDSKGTINVKKCSGCDLKFEGIENGEQRNTHIAIVKERKVAKFLHTEKKSSKKKGKKIISFNKSSEEKGDSKKNDEKSSGEKSESKETDKKSYQSFKL